MGMNWNQMEMWLIHAKDPNEANMIRIYEKAFGNVINLYRNYNFDFDFSFVA